MSNVVTGNFGGPRAKRASAPVDEAPREGVATLYGLDRCSTCEKARAWLQRKGVEHVFVDYKRNPVDAATLKSWAKTLGWEKLVNRAGTTWRALPPERREPASDAEWLLLVRDHPSLVRRPVVVLPDGRVSVGFTDKLFQSLFA